MAFAVKNSLFVRNLSPQVSETILRDAFGQCGDEIEHVVFRAFPNQNHQFFAQIDFKTSRGVAEGSKLSGTKILGTAIVTGVIDPINSLVLQPKQWTDKAGEGGAPEEMVGPQGVQAEYFRLQKEAADDQRFRTVHVAGLPDNVKDEGLKKMCAHFGEVLSCRIDADPFGKVFGLVEFKEKGPAHVCKAQREFFVHGRILTFSESKTMVDVVSFTEKNVHFQDTVFDALNLRTAMAQQGLINMKLNAVREAAKELGMVKEDAPPEKPQEPEKDGDDVAKDDRTALVPRSRSQSHEQKRRGKAKKHKKKKQKLASWEEAIGVGEGLDDDGDRKRAKKEKKVRKRKKEREESERQDGRSCSGSGSKSGSGSRSGSPHVQTHSLENAVVAGREGVPVSLHDELANLKRAEDGNAAASDDDDESSEESRPVEIAEDDELCLVGNTEKVVLGAGSSSSSDSSDSEDNKQKDVLDDSYELDLEVMGAKKLRSTHRPIPVAVLIRAGLLKRKGRGFAEAGPVNMELDSQANLEADGLEEVEGGALGAGSPADSSPLSGGASPAPPPLDVDDADADSEGLDADNFEADLEVVVAAPRARCSRPVRGGGRCVSSRRRHVGRPERWSAAPSPSEDLDLDSLEGGLDLEVVGPQLRAAACDGLDADAFEADLEVVGAQRPRAAMLQRDGAQPTKPRATARRAPAAPQRTISMEIDVEAAAPTAPKRVRARPKPTISLGVVDDASEASDNLEFDDDLSFVQSPLPTKSPATASPAPTASPATIPVGMTRAGAEDGSCDLESGLGSSSSDSVSDVESLN